jgi:hypothetical protein
VVAPSWTPGFTYLVYILFKACSKGHFGNNCNETCDGLMDVYLNYVTAMMECVILKTYAKQDGTVLSVKKVHV